MSKVYDISTLEKLTDIKAHTIRIWEQRYRLLNPERTATNIRVYNDTHLQKLLNIKLLLDYGYKISEVAEMSDDKIKSTILNIIKTTSHTAHVVYEYIQNELLMATENIDEVLFERIYLNAINKYGIYKTIKDIVYPFLNRVGIMWALGNISPLQEHFASQIIIRKLQSAIDALDIVHTSKTSYALFLFPNEYHQIPLLFSNYILRSHKKQTYYLGEDVPIENIIEVVKYKKIDYLVTFITAYTVRIQDEYVMKLKKLSQSIPDNTQIILGGHAEALQNIAQQLKSKKILLNKNPEDFIKLL